MKTILGAIGRVLKALSRPVAVAMACALAAELANAVDYQGEMRLVILVAASFYVVTLRAPATIDGAVRFYLAALVGFYAGSTLASIDAFWALVAAAVCTAAVYEAGEATGWRWLVVRRRGQGAM